MSELALYESAKEALATAVRVDEVLDILDGAARAKAYAKIAKDRRLVADAQELIARAERKLGIMIRRIKDDGLLSAGGRPTNSNLDEQETGNDGGPVFDATSFTLADLGISKNLSSRAQQLAELDDDAFEHEVSVKRDKILSADAAVVSPPKARTASRKSDKPEPGTALTPEVFHRFAFSVLAMTMASDRVSSEAIHFLAEHLGIVQLDGEAVDFAPAAMEAMGTLADVALKAMEGEPKPAPTDALALREAYEGEIALLGARKGKLTMAEAEGAMRAGYAAEVAVLLLAQDLGHPLGTVKGWANRLGLTNRARMLAAQQRFGSEP